MKYEDWAIRYGAIVRKRTNKGEKLKYLSGIKKELEDMGCKTQLKVTKAGKEEIYNLYGGNINKAEYIISAYYDTPPSTYGTLPYKLFNEQNRLHSILISSIIPVLLLMLMGGLFINGFASRYWSDGNLGFGDIISILTLIILFTLVYKSRRGIAVQTNFIRNTSSVIAALKFCSEVTDKDKEKLAFVFTDYGCINGIGDKLLSESKGKHSTVIHLDSVGNSQPLYLFYPKEKGDLIKKLKEREDLETITPIELEDLPKALTEYQVDEIYLASASKEGNEFVMKKDRDIKNFFDIENLDRTIGCLKALTSKSYKKI